MKAFILLLFNLNINFKIMKKDLWKTIINVAIAALTALATALGVTM